ncbi:MAG: hypothetical protein HY595_05885 [Candidatus Omnitrophica bacterium]|nr:hypothetical protein [Candidatus Omnitrophota bacterium]
MNVSRISYLVFRQSALLLFLLPSMSVMAAERKPIEQLPGDVVRWSTTWAEIPKQMFQVGQEEGPLSGLTWGSAKGTAVMIRSTTDVVWELVKPDSHPEPKGREKKPGVILHYEF